MKVIDIFVFWRVFFREFQKHLVVSHDGRSGKPSVFCTRKFKLQLQHGSDAPLHFGKASPANKKWQHLQLWEEL